LNMLSDARDSRRLRVGLLYLLGLVQHPQIDAIAEAVVLDDLGTEISELTSASDEELDAWIRRNVADYVHVAGSCRMGAVTNPESVVDPTGRVIGYRGLRVCDASVFPDLPRANLHLPTVMVAERMAQMMRAGF
jgi:5-(hydroxymethyl)furfural/furfural oxidase